MVDFNKKFIDTKELQSKITKLKNSIINSITDKGTADLNVCTTDLSNIKSSNEETSKLLTGINLKIKDLYTKVKELNDKSDKVVDLEVMINTNNTQRISKDEELKRGITKIEKFTEDLPTRVSN